MRLGKPALFVLLCPVMAHAAACPTGYTYSKVFVVPSQNVASTLTAFPVLLPFNGITPIHTSGITTPTSFTLADLKASGSGGTILSSGNDIVFCDAVSGGNLLNFERATYTGTTGAAEFWVGRTLSSSTATNIWMFYGKASDTDHSNAAALWSAANYALVQHYGDGTTLSVTDSAGTYTPTNHSATATTGEIAGGVNLVAASSQWIDAGNSVNPVSGTYTVEAWVNQNSAAVGSRVIGNLTNSPYNGYELFINTSGTDNKIVFQVGNAGSLNNVTGLPPGAANGLWSQVAGTSNAGALTLYGNGMSIGTPVTRTVGTSTVNFNVGRWPGNSAQFCNCVIDEVRVSTTTAQSAAWEAANYLTQFNPTGFAVMEDDATPAGMSSGAYCVPLTINHAQVPNTDQTNFNLLVHGIYPWMADTAHGGFAVVGNSARDIRFFSNSGCTTALDFERIYSTNTTGDSSFRVRVPSVSHTTDTTIYVRIGSPLDTADASTLWMASYNYSGVYAGSDPASIGTLDSGVANLTLGCGANAFATATPVGGGFYFDNTQTDAATCGVTLTVPGDTLSAHGYATGSNAGHIRMWGRTTLLTSSGGTFNDVEFGGYGKANGSGQRGFETEYRTTQITGMESTLLSNGDPGVLFRNDTTTPTFTMDYNWHVYDFDLPTNGATLGASAMYIDGQLLTVPYYFGGSSSSVLNTNNTVCCTNQPEVRLGRTPAHGDGWLNGFVAQYEATSFSMSADTVKARYTNELSPWLFYSFGTATPFVPATTNQPIVSVLLSRNTPPLEAR